MAIKACFLDNRMFDWQTMSIPAWDVTGIETLHSLVLHDNVLKSFVKGMTHMQVAVCVRRAIMQDKLLTPLA